MTKEKIRFAFVLAFSLVLAWGIVLASITPNSCHCWEACYYCDWQTGNCTIYNGPGGCFCTTNPCRLGHWLCCVHEAY